FTRRMRAARSPGAASGSGSPSAARSSTRTAARSGFAMGWTAEAPSPCSCRARRSGRPRSPTPAREEGRAMTMPRRFLLALVVPALTAGCAARPFHDHFEAGRFAEAARAFEEDPSLERDERALLRAAIVYAIPNGPDHRPDRARVLVRRNLERDEDDEDAPH